MVASDKQRQWDKRLVDWMSRDANRARDDSRRWPSFIGLGVLFLIKGVLTGHDPWFAMAGVVFAAIAGLAYRERAANGRPSHR